MPLFVQILGLPFLACILMGTILAYLGIHVLKREVIFIDIAVAQVAAVGSIAAHLAFDAEQDSLLAYATSLLCVLLISASYAAARTAVVQISIEAVIGISYAITAAAAMFLIGMHPGHVHAEEMLAGSLLWVTWRHIIASAVVFSAVGIMLYLFRKPISEVSQDYDRAVAGGLKAVRWDFLFYALLGAVITLAVRISGVVSVFAFLIIPATTSALFARNWAARLLIAWATAFVASIAGLLFAYYLDFSVGPAIALFLGGALVVAAVLRLTVLKPLGRPAEAR